MEIGRKTYVLKILCANFRPIFQFVIRSYPKIKIPRQVVPIRLNRGFFCYALSEHSTEAMACLTITWASNAGHMDITVLTDLSNLVQVLRLEGYRDVTIKWTIEQIRNIVRNFTSCQVLKVSCTQVKQAHQLAQWCHKNPMDFANIVD